MALSCFLLGKGIPFALLLGAIVAISASLFYTPSSYNSVIHQSIHYFSRPHQGPRLEPVASPSAWIGEQLALHPEEWTYEISEAERIEMIEEMKLLSVKNKTLTQLTKHDLLLPSLTAKLPRWREQLTKQGRGFQIIRGTPVDVWTEREIESFYWIFGLKLGVPGAQDSSGELLGHVRDIGADALRERQYKTNASIDFHCDIADVVGLLCVRTAKVGGQSRLISSVTIFNELLKLPNGAAHAERLFQPLFMDARGSGGVDYFSVTPLRHYDGVVRTCYHKEYFRSAHKYPHAPAMNEETRAALDAYDAITERPELWISMDLRPGDIQLVSNHFILHARAGYEDHDDPQLRRHLLRLWLSLDNTVSVYERLLVEWDRLRVLRSLLAAKLARWLA